MLVLYFIAQTVFLWSLLFTSEQANLCHCESTRAWQARPAHTHLLICMVPYGDSPQGATTWGSQQWHHFQRAVLLANGCLSLDFIKLSRKLSRPNKTGVPLCSLVLWRLMHEGDQLKVNGESFFPLISILTDQCSLRDTLRTEKDGI